MNAKELFALFLRIVGVLGVVVILRHALALAPLGAMSSVYLDIKWIVGIIVAVYLIRGAPLLMKFAYPEKPAAPAP